MSGVLDPSRSRSIEEPVIEARSLVKHYRHGWWGRQSVAALKGVDLDMRRGEVFGLLGPNGAGKTTLIKILLGIIHPNRGEARILGEPAGSKLARQRIGYLPENLVFPRHHSGAGALAFYGRLSGLSRHQIQQRMGGLLEQVGLQGRQNEPVRKYSKGMRQRLGLAQALLHEPEILILDEPTDGLDPLGRSQIRELIEDLRDQGRSVFLNSHILQEVELVCDRVAIMAHGQLKAIGTIEELIERHSPSRGIEMVFEVQGPAWRCHELFVGPQVRQLERIPGGGELEEAASLKDDAALETVDPSLSDQRFRIRLDVEHQRDGDGWIDRIRAAGLSLLGFHRHRLKLEDIFVQLVDRLESEVEVERR